MEKRYREMIRNKLDARRYEHSLRVAEEAVTLAERFGANQEDALCAGLLHDYAKNLPPQELLELAETNDLIADPCERWSPHLLHGPVAAWQLWQEGVVEDLDILDAIASHTVGHPQLCLLAKIVYLADYIEPKRTTPGIEEVRMLAKSDLDGALLLCVNRTVGYLLKKGLYIHPAAVALRNELYHDMVRKESLSGLSGN